MMRVLSALVVLLGCSATRLAAAQELGRKGDAVFSAERLMGITGTHVSGESGGRDYDEDRTSLSFAWRGSPSSSPFDVPRLAFDYFAIDHLSIGGSLGYSSTAPDEGGDASAFLLAARVGYVYAFGRVVGIWPRGGFSYHSLNIDNGFDENGFGLTLECPFTFSPAAHWAFSVGPSFDVDLFGERDPSPVSAEDRKYRMFGLQAGVLGWF